MTTGYSDIFVAGVDGCKDGWVIASEAGNGQIAIERVTEFREVLARKYATIVVDIPIGLLDSGPRLADSEARKILKGRSCCVFPAPLRQVIACSDYESASKCRFKIDGKKLTTQTWAIIPKIREVDPLLTPEIQYRVREGHPEVSFARMNNNEALRLKKRTKDGRQARTSLLSNYFPNIEADLQKHHGIEVDVIDAHAMLWTARRVRNGDAKAVPKNSPKDARGLLMQIWV